MAKPPSPHPPATGFVDTHIHILPGIDDGPATMEDAVAMAEVAAAAGTARLIATPHANYQFEFQPETVKRLRQELQALAPPELEIHVGCELHLSYENVQAALARPREYTLGGGRYLLVEFPEFFDGASLRNVLQQLLGAGMVPLLAHPERNTNFQQHEDLLLEFLRLGCRGQVTASSFTGRFGKRAQQFSRSMLERGWICAVASDGHSARQRPPVLSTAFETVAELSDWDTARTLFISNPEAMLLDRELPQPDLPATVKRRGFWARLSNSSSA